MCTFLSAEWRPTLGLKKKGGSNSQRAKGRTLNGDPYTIMGYIVGI